MLLDLITAVSRRHDSGSGNIQYPGIPLSADRILEYLGDNRSSLAGVKVNRNTVLGLPAFMRGIRLVSESVAKLPLVVYRRLPEGGKERATSHPAYRLLKSEANAVTTSFSFIRTLTANALLHGNGYAAILRDEAKRPLELFQLDPIQTHPVMEIFTSPAGVREFRVKYVTYVSGKPLAIEWLDMLHLKGFSHDGIMGESLLDVARDSLGLGLGVQKYSSVYFKNNARPNVVIRLPGQLRDEEAIERFRKSWGDVHQGVDNSHRPALLENGADVATFNVTAEDSQLIESRKLTLIDVANLLGIPPQKLGAEVGTSYNSLEQQNKDFLNDGLGGLLCDWKHECEAKLRTEREKREDSIVIEQVRDELERADRATEASADVELVNNGILLGDEVRAKRNLPPLPDGIGQAMRMPMNIAVAGQAPVEPEPEPLPTIVQVDEDDEPRSYRAELHGQLRFEFARFVTRLKNAAIREARTPAGFLDWLDGLRSKHEHVLAESILPALGAETAANLAGEFVVSVHTELLEASGRVNGGQLVETVSQIMNEFLIDAPEGYASKAMGE